MEVSLREEAGARDCPLNIINKLVLLRSATPVATSLADKKVEPEKKTVFVQIFDKKNKR